MRYTIVNKQAIVAFIIQFYADRALACQLHCKVKIAYPSSKSQLAQAIYDIYTWSTNGLKLSYLPKTHLYSKYISIYKYINMYINK